MLFLKRFFGSGKPAVREEPSDRIDYDIGRGLTPEKIDRIMLAANTGDTEEQCRLAREILEKNADIMQALSTRKNAVIGCDWRLEPGDESEEAKRAAETLQTVLRDCGGNGSDSFDDLLEDLLGALLPGFAISEILWTNGGGLAGFHHIEQKHFTFVDGYISRLVTSDNPHGVEIDRRRIVFHKVRFHGGDPARGGLIRPLAWLHCFKTVDEKDLLSFIERHGMPFIAAKVDTTAFEKEKNLVKRLIRNFGSSGGGIFTKNVELQLLECKNNGEAYFRLLEYLEAAVNKVILGQTASSGDSSGLSKGDAQSKVRQDILESDCRVLQRTVNTQILRPWTDYNFGPSVASPQLVINCAAPEDSEKNANTLKTLFEAGFEADAQEVSERFGWNLKRRAETAGQTGPGETTTSLKELLESRGVAIRAGLLTATPEIEAQTRAELGLPPMSEEVKKAWAATGGIRQPITLKTAEEAAVAEALDVDDKAAAAKPIPMAAETLQLAEEVRKTEDTPRALLEWLGRTQPDLPDLADGSDEELKEALDKGLPVKFGDSGKFEDLFVKTGIAAAAQGIADQYNKVKRNGRIRGGKSMAEKASQSADVEERS